MLKGRVWQRRIRRANTAMAVSLIFLSAVWLTPILNAERISANSHADRFISGRMPVKDLAVWQLGTDWGVAGEAALARIRALTDHPEQDALSEKLARFDAGVSERQYLQARRQTSGKNELAALKQVLPVLPRRQVVPEGALDEVPRVMLEKINTSCTTPLADGRPGCAAVVGSFLQQGDQVAVVVFWRGDEGTGTEIITLERNSPEGRFDYLRSVFAIGGDLETRSAEGVLARIQNGGFRFKPARLQALEIDGVQIIPRR